VSVRGGLCGFPLIWTGVAQNGKFCHISLVLRTDGAVTWKAWECDAHGRCGWFALVLAPATVHLVWAAIIRDSIIAIISIAAIVIAMPSAVFFAVVVSFAMLEFALLAAIILCVLWVFAYGGNLPLPSANGEKGIGEALSVLAFILTQLIALTAAQAGRRALRDESNDFQWATIATAIPLAIATFATLVVMIRMTIAEGGKVPKRYYGSGAIKFMRWVLFCGAVIGLLFGRLAWSGGLPTQVTFKNVPLKTIHAQSFVFPDKENPQTDGTQGVRVFIPITKADFPDGVPSKLFVEVAVGAAVCNTGWRVVHARLFDGEPESNIRHSPAVETEPYVDDLSIPLPRTIEVSLKELKPDSRYTLALFLWQPDAKARASVKSIVDLVNDPKQEAFTVVAVMKAK
jgi:hypothetical protein